jgi:regulator of nucleoside diphosphate kinase
LKVKNMAKPKIVISKTDHGKLTQLANGLLERKPELADNLLNELERARVAEDKAIPARTIRMGSTVTYKTGESAERTVTLVYPGDADIEKGKISILTPIGTALLGLSVDQTIDFTSNDGRAHKLTVLTVDTVAVTAA